MKRWLTLVTTGALAVPTAALADFKQDARNAGSQPAAAPTPVKEPAGGEAAADQGGEGDQGGGEMAPTPAQNAPAGDRKQTGDTVNLPGTKGPPPVVNETHTVVKGDTLWDLSQKYLGNPWYWPKVWSYNPQIANPHWIYPGNEVRFGPGGDEEAAQQVETPNAPTPTGDDDSVPTLQDNDDDNEPGVKATGKIAYTGPRTSSFRQDNFITDRELEESGQLVKSKAETEMLTDLDVVYLRFKSEGDAKVGDRFFIYNTVRDIIHPISHQRVGYLTHIVGTVKVTALGEGGMVTGVIDHSYDTIARGDYLAPYSDKISRDVQPKPATQKIEGRIIDSINNTDNIGEQMVLFIDKGKRDGVEEGDLFDVVRRFDGSASGTAAPTDPGYEDPRLPVEVLGRLLVIDAKETASTCLAVRSVRELQPGDKVVSVTASGTTGPVSQR